MWLFSHTRRWIKFPCRFDHFGPRQRFCAFRMTAWRPSRLRHRNRIGL
ncbi:hypothetical protein Y88_3242 [Novosphingobium nitrogenifigens DSM 19370]|uniref:Uncharacterized protein n=1 Tax=Novosphingobium nitrogenifigens DSM 19370 TaxID=983920 RepID=F1ZBK4_9SPHN|nr:hypothetical protein Y88_3242 [Novosphingobium nitrogenifigens DSM 19370]